MKFGGTSVGSATSILNLKNIVEAEQQPVVVVVSALGGITDKLIKTSQMAAAGDAEYVNEFQEIVTRHYELISAVIPEDKAKRELLVKVDALLHDLGNIFQGIFLINDLSPKSEAMIVSYGERISSLIVAVLIKDAKHYDSRSFIKTETKRGKYILDNDLTDTLIKEKFAGEQVKVAVVPGFISTDKETGEITNLGRGGSDYTASLIAASLNAEVLEIWTDVDGFMTADPNVIGKAYTIQHLSYLEATEL